MTLEWKQIDTCKWISGQHTIIWAPQAGYIHCHGARQRHNLPTFAAAKAWAETVEDPEYALLIVAERDLEQTIKLAIERVVWFEVYPLSAGLWQLRFKRADLLNFGMMQEAGNAGR